MASQDRPATDSVGRDKRRAAPRTLDDVLKHDPRSFSFYQLVRLLDPAFGRDGGPLHPQKEQLRFRATNDLSFPPADILELAPLPDSAAHGHAQERHLITVSFLGLHGSSSPLPVHYLEEALGDDPDNNPRRDFLDFFHHRALSLLWRCWEKYRYYVQYRAGATDPFSQRLFSFVGLYDKGLRGASHLNWERLLSYVGLLSGRARSGDVIAGVVAHCFSFEHVEVEEWVERWAAIVPSQRNALGGMNCTLGEDFHCGSRVPDISGKFHLRIGPLTLQRFIEFLPNAASYQALRELVHFMVRDQFDYTVQLILRERDVPAFHLGKDPNCLLGWSTWAGAPSGDQTVTLRGRGH